MASRFPRRTIALGPPYDDGAIPGEPAPEHKETGAEFVERIVRENALSVAETRSHMDRLDSKGRRIGWRLFNGRDQGGSARDGG